MQSTNVRDIKAAIQDQAQRGRRSVHIGIGRVINARTINGQLWAKTMSGKWYSVESITID